jgi:sugar lactone lactonase YvrE
VAKARKEKGFILVILLSLLLLLAVTAMSLNFKSGMQARMAANRTVDVQTYLDQLAVIEQSLWKLTGDPSWRVPAGENYAYHGRTYSRRVFGPDTVTCPALAGAAYRAAVIISVKAPNATRTVNKSFQYNIDTPFLIRKPRQVYIDSAGNIFFADVDNHSIWKIDAVTGAILRVAGKGTSGSSGDGGPATEAELNAPRGVCTDALGNVYIADTDNNRIRKVAAGFISTVVNTSGAAGSSGDGGLATEAKLDKPNGVWADASGNIYIADTDNHRIRKVTAATGIISTVAGTGLAGSSGDGGSATLAKFNKPRSVFVDSALNIFIADMENDRIRKVTAATGIISTVAGTSNGYSGDGGAATAAKLNKPYGVWVDITGNIYIADTNNHRIRKVTAADGKINTVAGTGTAGYSGDGGAATAANIDGPTGLCVKNTGEVIISDTNNSCLRKVSITNNISTLPMTVGPGLNSPDGVASYYDDNPDPAQKKLFLYIADQGNHRIRKLDTATNTLVTVAGTGSAGSAGDTGQATAAQLNSPSAVAVDASGNLYIADTGNNKIRKVTAIGGVITDSNCSSNCSIISPVAGTGSAGSSGDGGSATLAKLDNPEGVFVDASGNIFIADTNSNRIRKVTAGTISRISGSSGGFAGDGGDAGAGGVKFDLPQGIWVDASGNIYIGDTDNHRIRKITAATNIINTIAGDGTEGSSGDGGAATAAHLRNPQAVTVDGAGNIYIADTGNHRLRIVNHDATPVITTMAGIGTSGYNGDNQPAVQARLSSPRGVALGLTKAGGRIFISDTGNNRIRTLFLKTEQQVYGP